MSKLNKYFVTVRDRISGEVWDGEYYSYNEAIAAFLFIINETTLWLDENIDRSYYALEDLQEELDIQHGVSVLVEEIAS